MKLLMARHFIPPGILRLKTFGTHVFSYTVTLHSHKQPTCVRGELPVALALASDPRTCSTWPNHDKTRNCYVPPTLRLKITASQNVTRHTSKANNLNLR
jgi:hypothetical protein